jgi:nucleotide-binding universal stress UspA family protein
MRILVASDLTARSDRALARGFLLARQLDADLCVLHVVDADLPDELRAHSVEWAKQSLSRDIERMGSATGKRANLEVVAGDPGSYIVRAADPSATDLLLLGVHPGSGAVSKTFGETTAGKILKSSLTAALLVRGEAIEPYRSIVIGVDFSMFSRAAIRQVAQIASSARVHLVHAFQVPFKSRLGTESFINEVAYGQRLELDAFLKDEMGSLERRANDLGVLPGNLERIVEEGRPEQVLRAVRDRVSGDLVVIATHGRGAISRAIWGSVAVDLLGDPPCDVLVIKPF